MEKALSKIQGPNGPSSDDSRVLFRAEIPVGKHYSKKNSRVIRHKWGGRNPITGGRKRYAYPATNNVYAAAEQLLVSYLQGRARDAGLLQPIDVPVHCVWIIQLDNFLTKKGKINTRAGDISNLVQGPEDALQKAGILKDDALITSCFIRKQQGPNMLSVVITEAR